MTSHYISGVGLVRRRAHVGSLAPLPLEASVLAAAPPRGLVLQGPTLPALQVAPRPELQAMSASQLDTVSGGPTGVREADGERGLVLPALRGPMLPALQTTLRPEVLGPSALQMLDDSVIGDSAQASEAAAEPLCNEVPKSPSMRGPDHLPSWTNSFSAGMWQCYCVATKCRGPLRCVYACGQQLAKSAPIIVSEQGVGHPPTATVARTLPGELSCQPTSLSDLVRVEAFDGHDVEASHAGDAGAQAFTGAIDQAGPPSEQLETDDSVQLFPCSSCGRKFRKEALERHAAICERVFRSRRKVYDMTEHRLFDPPELAEAWRRAQAAVKADAGIDDVQKKAAKKPRNRWRQESEAIRAAFKDARLVKKYKTEAMDPRAQKYIDEVKSKNKEEKELRNQWRQKMKALRADITSAQSRPPTFTLSQHVWSGAFSRKRLDTRASALITKATKAFRAVAQDGRLVEKHGKERVDRVHKCIDKVKSKNEKEKELRNQWRQKMKTLRAVVQDGRLVEKHGKERVDRVQEYIDEVKSKSEAKKESRNHWRQKMKALRAIAQDGQLVLADHVHKPIPKAAAKIQLFPCSLCDRTFRKEVLEMHAKICQRVFQSKRDVYIPQDAKRKWEFGQGRAAPKWKFGLGETMEVVKKPEAIREASKDALVEKCGKEKHKPETKDHQEKRARNSTRKTRCCFFTAARRRDVLSAACVRDEWDMDTVLGHSEHVETDVIRDDRCLPSWSPARDLSARQRERRVRHLDIKFGSNLRRDFPHDILPPEQQVQIRICNERWHRDLAHYAASRVVWCDLETDVITDDICLSSWFPARVLSASQRERRIRSLDVRFSSNLHPNFVEEILPPKAELQTRLFCERRNRDLAREAVHKVVWCVLGLQDVAWPEARRWSPESPITREKWVCLAQRSQGRSRRPAMARASRRTRILAREKLRAMATATALRRFGASAASHRRSHNLGFGRPIADRILDFLAPALLDDSRQRVFEIMDTDQDGVVDSRDFALMWQEPMAQLVAISAASVYNEISGDRLRCLRAANVYASLEAWGSRVHAHLRAARPYLEDAATSVPT